MPPSGPSWWLRDRYQIIAYHQACKLTCINASMLAKGLVGSVMFPASVTILNAEAFAAADKQSYPPYGALRQTIWCLPKGRR